MNRMLDIAKTDHRAQARDRLIPAANAPRRLADPDLPHSRIGDHFAGGFLPLLLVSLSCIRSQKAVIVASK